MLCTTTRSASSAAYASKSGRSARILRGAITPVIAVRIGVCRGGSDSRMPCGRQLGVTWRLTGPTPAPEMKVSWFTRISWQASKRVKAWTSYCGSQTAGPASSSSAKSGYGSIKFASEYGSTSRVGTPAVGEALTGGTLPRGRTGRSRHAVVASGIACDSFAMGDHAFIVELKDGTELEVGADQTILDAIEASGRRVLTSCREGNCGTCETNVLAGEVDHRDEVLDDDEKASNDVMMICVSRAKGERLVLDL